MLIDLHTHSTESDGTDTPAALVAEAARAGLSVVALTDHDTTRGWAEAADAAQDVGVTLVRGIEISCVHEGTGIHLLGYLLDPHHGPLLAELERARDSRATRARRIVEALAQDVPITWEEVVAQVGPGATLGRPHIADALVAGGVVPDRDAAFSELLHDDSPYYRSHYAIDVFDAVRLVRAAGGVPVMAHPFAAGRGAVVSDDVVEAMADAGLAGLEAHHLDHDAAQEARAVDLARRLGLVVTGSSDYHGDGKKNRLADRTTAPDVYEALVAQAGGVPVVEA